jgi:dTDP-glucose 4,6-dehydratase
MRCLVTGGAGFIGSTLVRQLLEGGETVVTLDLLTYAGHRANLTDVLDHPRHHFVHGDVCDGPLVRDLMDGVDVVYHLAAESHVDRSIAEDQPFVRTNVVGTATMLAAALDAGVRRFVHVSTDEVYGELPWVDPEGPGAVDAPRFTEWTPLAPRSPYSATKAGADHLALAYYATHGLDVVITRGSNTYGPRQYPEKLIPFMIRRALADRSLPVYGDGLHVRDWMHVEDHGRGIVAAAEHGTAGSVYNLGADCERTNLGVVRRILELLEKPAELVEHVRDRPGHDRRYGLDASRARSELQWAPAVAFDDGLPACVRWYREHEAWTRTVAGTARAHGPSPRVPGT